jgi:hypothetical protein
MAEPGRETDPTAPQNPPHSVLNRQVRRSAVRAYIAPLVVFFAGVGLVLAIWMAVRPTPTRDVAEPLAERTTGTERGRVRDETPGGHNPDRRPATARDETAARGGREITELGEAIENGGRGVIGRRVELRGVTVERVESPTLFWLRDGEARVAVVAAGMDPVRAGQQVDVSGSIERTGGGVRIRASRVEARP